MKITIFGATGRTGKHLVEKALTSGHWVNVLVRNPAKLGVQDERLCIIQGDIKDRERVAEAVAGVDAVISVLGPTSNQPTFEISRGTENILAAMHKHGVRRLVVSAGAGVGDPNDEPKLFNKLMNVLLKLAARHVYEDMQRVVDLVRASDRDWTVVRVPMLTDDPASGKIRVGYVGEGMGPRISRADMARFMLQQVENPAYLRQAPAISN